MLALSKRPSPLTLINLCWSLVLSKSLCMIAVIFYIHIAIISTLPMVIYPIFNSVSFILSSRLMFSLPPRRKSDSPCVSLAILSCFPSLSLFFFFGYTITHHLFPLYCSFRGRVLRGLCIFIITFFSEFLKFLWTPQKKIF